MENLKFTILIATKNRAEELLFTLSTLKRLKENNTLEIVVFDDGSTDQTFEKVKANFPDVILHRNDTSKGYLYCRNFMLNQTKAEFAISLDDDAHFLSDNPLQEMEQQFQSHPNCGVIAFRIFWEINPPENQNTNQIPEQVKGFVGCGHAWRTKTWKKIPNYPEWFEFFGEEDFASFLLFKNNFTVTYLPSVLVQHRVNVVARKKNKDYYWRLRCSFRSGWYLYFLFYPWQIMPKKLAYTLYFQLKNKLLKGQYKATFFIFKAIVDVFVNLPNLVQSSNRLTLKDYKEYEKITETKIFWKEEIEL